MPNIEDQKLLYHLTSIGNIGGILANGLKPRAELHEFEDVADDEIIEGRRALLLEEYVPFHWFARNPFDGSVQVARPDELFVLITVHRDLAKRKNWKIIPRHPLSASDIELLDYADGFAAIDWEAMNQRDYHDPLSKRVCMAECLSPRTVQPSSFYNIFVCCDKSATYVKKQQKKYGVDVDVLINSNMFVS